MTMRALFGICLALVLGCTAYVAVAVDESCMWQQQSVADKTCSQKEAETMISSYQLRATHTRVGTLRSAPSEKQLSKLCTEGNAAREAMALQLSGRMEQQEASAFSRGDMVKRLVKLKQPCA